MASGCRQVDRKVLVLGTGGTIASEPTPDGYQPLRNDAFFRRIRHHPQLSDAEDTLPTSIPVAVTKIGETIRYPLLRTPALDDEGSQVSYHILDLENHMDSSEMTPADWNIIAGLLDSNWDDYDGFIVLSGTDTLAYTASILTFLFADSGKPIVVTGAQIPLSQPRSDGWDNILESLLVAGLLPYTGVGVVFYHRVMHGSRATKVSPNLLEAFTSPCVPTLIDLNVKLTFQPNLPPRTTARHTSITPLLTIPTVLSCAIYPGITGSTLTAQINAMPSCKAVILSAFGSGNIPIHPKAGILDALQGAVRKEILVVVISQCAIPNIYPLYTQGRKLLSIGVCPGYDMTHEAAFAKLVWLVSRTDLTFADRQRLFQTPLVGEMSI